MYFIMFAIIQYFNDQLLYCYISVSDFNTLNAGRSFKKSPLVVFYEASLDMFLEIFRAKHRQFLNHYFSMLLLRMAHYIRETKPFLSQYNS